MKLSLSKVLLPVAALAAATALGTAQIERLNLDQMVERTDNAVQGTIIAKQAFRVDHPVDGPELYFTRITIQGTSTYTGNATTVDVIYHGGFINENEGVYNSEAPSEAETEIGNSILAFYRFTDNMAAALRATPSTPRTAACTKSSPA